MPDRLAAAIAGKDSAEVVRALGEDTAAILRDGDIGQLLRAAAVIAPELDDDLDRAAPLRALVCLSRSETLMGLGRVDEAVSELDQARSFARDAESPLLGLIFLWLGEAHRIRGNASQASAAYREAIERAEASEQAQVLVLALAGLARSVLGEDLEQALEPGPAGSRPAGGPGSGGPLAGRGVARSGRGERERAIEHGQAAAREAGRQHDARGLAESLELQALAGPPEPGARPAA